MVRMFTALGLSILGAAGVAAATPLAGNWQGSLALPKQSLKLVFHLAGSGSSFSGTMDSPDQGASGIPLQQVRLNGANVRLRADSVAGTFSGTLGKDGKSLRGRWRQGATLPLTLKRSGGGVSGAGEWEGSLNVRGQALRIVLHLAGPNGKLSGTMDSPDQAARGIPLEQVALAGGRLRAEARTVGVVYTGTMSKDGRSLSGSWWQGMDLPLTLRKSP